MVQIRIVRIPVIIPVRIIKLIYSRVDNMKMKYTATPT